MRHPLPRDPAAPARARALVGQFIGHRGFSGDSVENATLVVSELVTNALKHGKGAIELLLGVDRSTLTIEVVDQGDHPERVHRRPAGGDGGWGLHLVAALSSDWGVYEGTTHVWARMELA